LEEALKNVFALIFFLVGTLAFAAEKANQKTTQRKPASTSGQYTCEEDSDIERIERFLQASCDTSKPFSMTNVDDGYLHYSVCCIHK
jgi:hypothetical protein